jgi:hypothetical protein
MENKGHDNQTMFQLMAKEISLTFFQLMRLRILEFY